MTSRGLRGLDVRGGDAAPVSAATLPAFSGSREAIVTVWPARVNDVASARPTLPAPMMAMFMAVILPA